MKRRWTFPPERPQRWSCVAAAAVLGWPAASLAEGAQATDFLPRFAHREQRPALHSHLRVEPDADGLLVADLAFGSGGHPTALELPAHLGKGYVFYQPVAVQGRSATNVYYAERFTGPLRPLAQLPFVVQSIRAGFDRLYVLAPGIKIALDPKSGAVLPLDPLPPLVTIETLEFAGSGRAALSAPLLGVLGTTDAGLSWRPIRDAVSVEAPSGAGQLLVHAHGSTFALGPELELLPPPKDKEQDAGYAAWRAQIQQLGFSSPDDWGQVLTTAISRGVKVGKSIVALEDGQLLIASSSGPFQVTRAQAPTEQMSCLGVPERRQSALFLCRGQGVSLLRYSSGRLTKLFESPLTKDRSAANAPRLLAFGRGAFLLAGACAQSSSPAPTPSPTADELYCHWSARGARTLLLPKPSPTASLERHRSFVTDDAGAWRLVWEDGSKQFRALRLASDVRAAPSVRVFPVTTQESLLPLLAMGSLLPNAQVDEEGFRVWVVQGERFVGVQLLAQGGLDYGAVQRPLSHASFYGKNSLIWGAAGFVKQSVDGGMHFEELTMPYRSGDIELSAPLDEHTDAFMGCGDAGCVMGHWIKRGWGLPKTRELPIMTRTPLPPGAGGRHHYACGSGGRPSAPRRHEPASSFEGFWELGAPALPHGFVGTSVGFPHDVARLYAYGPREVPWSRDGRVELWYLDPYDHGSISKSHATSNLVDSFVAAEAMFGTDQGSAVTELVLDPDGSHGVVVLRARSGPTLFTVERDQNLLRVPVVDSATGQDVDLRSIHGAVYSRGQYFLGLTWQRDRLAVARLDERGFSFIAQFPLGEAAARFHALVRSTDGDLGVAMDGDAGLLVYPLEANGALGPPLVLPDRDRRPENCAPETFGFIVDWEVPLTPHLENLDEDPIKVHGLHQKMLVYPKGACLEAMSARVRAVPHFRPAPAGAQTVPLVLQNADSKGNRLSLTCE